MQWRQTGDLTRQLKLGSAFEVNKETGILKFTVEKDTDREELAAVLSALNGENIDAKDISAIGLDLKGKWSKPETRFLHNGEKRGFALSLNLLVFSRRESDEAIRIPVAFAFSADSSGALNLESIRSSSTRKPVAACPTMRTLLAGMKLELIRLLLDQNLRGTEKQKIVVDIAEGKENESERVLIFQILPK